MQKEVLLSYKLRDDTYEYWNLFELKEDNLSQINYQNQLSHPGLSHTEQESQVSLIQGKIHKIRTKASNIRKAKLQRVVRFKIIWFTCF